MKFLIAVLPPLTILLIFLLFIPRLWRRLDKLKKITNDNGSTRDLSERIYRNFEFFVKIFLAIVGGFGYVKFTYGSSQTLLAQQALMGIGFIGMITRWSHLCSPWPVSKAGRFLGGIQFIGKSYGHGKRST